MALARAPLASCAFAIALCVAPPAVAQSSQGVPPTIGMFPFDVPGTDSRTRNLVLQVEHAIRDSLARDTLVRLIPNEPERRPLDNTGRMTPMRFGIHGVASGRHPAQLVLTLTDLDSGARVLTDSFRLVESSLESRSRHTATRFAIAAARHAIR